MAARRPARVAHLVQAELAALLLRDAKDPRLQHVTVTAVRMTPDLRVAHVFFRTLGAGDADGGTRRALERAAHYLRGELGRSLGLRLTPELRFEYDTTPDTAQRLEDLLRAGTRDRKPDDDEGT
jgi:ribosome-binding factor A